MHEDSNPTNHCCCGRCYMHVTTGTLVLVTFHVIATLGSFFGSGVVPLHMTKPGTYPFPEPEPEPYYFGGNASVWTLQTSQTVKQNMQAMQQQAVAPMAAITLADGIVTLIVGGLTLAGIVQKQAIFLVPLVALQLVNVIFFGIASVICFILLIIFAITGIVLGAVICGMLSLLFVLLFIVGLLIYKVYKRCYLYLKEQQLRMQSVHFNDNNGKEYA